MGAQKIMALTAERDRKKRHKQDKRRIWRVGACVFVVVFALWLATPLLIPYMNSVEREDTVGQFGDQFGWMNSLFSGFAFAGVVVAIFLQGKELEYQREELELQRNELKLSTKAQNDAAAALEKRLGFEQKLAKQRLSLDMCREWASADMHQARREAMEDSCGDGIRRVCKYVEQWVILKEEKLLDHPLLFKFMKQYVIGWRIRSSELRSLSIETPGSQGVDVVPYARYIHDRLEEFIKEHEVATRVGCSDDDGMI